MYYFEYNIQEEKMCKDFMTGHLFTTGDGSLSFWHNSSCPSFSSFVFSLYLYVFFYSVRSYAPS